MWTTSQFAFVDTNITNILADDIKTSTRFKKVHLNACTKALTNILSLVGPVAILLIALKH